MIVLPTAEGVPEYEQETDLEGQTYLFRFSWDARISRWLMDIADGNDNPIRVGIVLVPNVSLLRKVADSRKPPGILAVQSTSGDAPGLYDLHPGGDSRLVYYSAAELAAALEA